MVAAVEDMNGFSQKKIWQNGISFSHETLKLPEQCHRKHYALHNCIIVYIRQSHAPFLTQKLISIGNKGYVMVQLLYWGNQPIERIGDLSSWHI